MEYIQMTLGDWINAKENLRKELQNVKLSFVRIGYFLRKIDDAQAYKQEGYESVSQFAKNEFGLEASTVSRLMNINKEYSLEGYSETLDPKYKDFNRSQLEEMLKLPEPDREMIRPETSRQEIRDLKKFNKEEPVPEETDDLIEVIKKFYEANPDVLNEVLLAFEDDADIKQVIEIIIPSGNRSHRCGIFFMMMYEEKILFKKFGSNPAEMTWVKFFEITKEIYPEQQYLKKEEPDPVLEEKTEIKEEPKEKLEDSIPETEKTVFGIETKKITESTERLSETEIAPAQFNEDKEDFLEEEKEKNVSNETEETVPETEENETEIIEVVDKYSTRKEYLDGCTEWGMAVYLSRALKNTELTIEALCDPYVLEKWLKMKVDENGNEIEED